VADYTELFAALREHGSLRKACRDLSVSRSAFLDAVANDSALADQYAREKQHGIDAMMEDLIDKDIEDAAKDRLEWDRKRWHASKLAPRKYGDKLDVTSGGERLNGDLAAWMDARRAD
jgi:hypothetical protein